MADLNAAVERSDGQVLGAALIPPIVTISLFVLAATTGLAVNLRRRRFALLRTVGATRGQVRRAILAELAVCGMAGGALGWLPGMALGGLGTRALAAHQMLPADSAAWRSPWLLLAAVTRAATGTWVPFIPLAPAAGLVLGVAALVTGAVMIPFQLMSRREPALAAG